MGQHINELRERGKIAEARNGRAGEAVKKQLDSLLKTKKDPRIRNP